MAHKAYLLSSPVQKKFADLWMKYKWTWALASERTWFKHWFYHLLFAWSRTNNLTNPSETQFPNLKNRLTYPAALFWNFTKTFNWSTGRRNQSINLILRIQAWFWILALSQTVWPWARSLMSQCINFFIYKTRIIIYISEDCCENYMSWHMWNAEHSTWQTVNTQ